jgi:tetratricopeptide (TPR) repeat protein
MPMDTDSQVAQAALAAGVAAFERGDHAAAAEHFVRLLHADPRNAAAHQYLGGIAFRAGRFHEALVEFEAACRLAPTSAQYYLDSAITHWRLGDIGAARRCVETALLLAPQLEAAITLLSVLTFPGPQYLDLLPAVHAHLRPRTYLEIGVFDGKSISLALPETRTIGIDPQPKIDQPLGPRTSVRAMTSDDYFAAHDVAGDLSGLPIDLAFIDGMHQFEFALRDFINVERHCSPVSTILIHDVYPVTRLSAERERQTGFWSGDIWRLILILKKHRPDLSVNVIATAPTGLALVRRLDPGSRVLQEHYEEIVREFLALDYSVLDADKPGMLALYPNDWEKIKALLG